MTCFFSPGTRNLLHLTTSIRTTIKQHHQSFPMWWNVARKNNKASLWCIALKATHVLLISHDGSVRRARVSPHLLGARSPSPAGTVLCNSWLAMPLVTVWVMPRSSDSHLQNWRSGIWELFFTSDECAHAKVLAGEAADKSPFLPERLEAVSD